MTSKVLVSNLVSCSSAMAYSNAILRSYSRKLASLKLSRTTTNLFLCKSRANKTKRWLISRMCSALASQLSEFSFVWLFVTPFKFTKTLTRLTISFMTVSWLQWATIQWWAQYINKLGKTSNSNSNQIRKMMSRKISQWWLLKRIFALKLRIGSMTFTWLCQKMLI